MMIKEYEGRTEKETVEKAVADLGLKEEEFDVEIVDSDRRGFLFRRGGVKIRVHIPDQGTEEEEGPSFKETEEKVLPFLSGLIERMGYEADLSVVSCEDGKMRIAITSGSSPRLIGKRGKTLDSIQILINVYAGRGLRFRHPQIVIDTENYRERRENSLIRMARKTAEEVKRTRSSQLLDPMNPFERRLVHLTLNDLEDIITKSEGDDPFRQIRILYKGSAPRD